MLYISSRDPQGRLRSQKASNIATPRELISDLVVTVRIVKIQNGFLSNSIPGIMKTAPGSSLFVVTEVSVIHFGS
jgi:hypothetical protein